MKKEPKAAAQAELTLLKEKVTQLEEKIKDLSANELARLRLAAIVESSDDAIISKDLNGIIQTWNAGAQHIFGYPAQEVIGKSITILIPPDRPNEEPAILEKIKRGERIDHYETERRRKDGTIIDISLTISPIKDSTGKIIGASKIARDITERKQTERVRQEMLEREKDAREKAEEASRVKDEFLSTISHELRTPLTSMVGWIRLLRTGTLDDAKIEKALETIERNVKSQAQLIEDLLDISRIITGRMRLEVQPVNPAGVINAAVDAVRPAADAKNITIQTVLDSRAGPVSGDFERMQQVLWNLLTNAVKFTQKGGRIRIQLERINSHVEIIVSDNGPGIEKDFLPYIFHRFSQADSSITRKYGGLGMGLAIVKHIVELHGGSISADSEGEGKGAVFVLKFPIMPISHPQPSAERVHSHISRGIIFNCPPQLEGLRVLVVDDDPDTCTILKMILERCKSLVQTALSVAQAREILAKWQPQILVSDIGMPDEDGYDLIRYVREREKSSKDYRLPAIALTAYARIEDRVRVLSAGFQMHVPKPVEPAELVSIVAGLTSIIK